MGPVDTLRARANHARIQLRGELRHAGDIVECPCCGHSYREFHGDKAPNRVCWWCGSYERERAIWLLWNQRPMLRAGMRVLHVAPEPILTRRLRAAGINQVGGDLDARFANRRIDVTSLEFADDSFDAVICNHVLEHVPDDQQAMRELRRVLRPGGWALLLTPLHDGPTDEDVTLTDPAERERRFGQHDHVRWYGRDDYLARLTGAGFTPEVLYARDVTQQLDRYALRLGDDGIIIAS